MPTTLSLGEDLTRATALVCLRWTDGTLRHLVRWAWKLDIELLLNDGLPQGAQCVLQPLLRLLSHAIHITRFCHTKQHALLFHFTLVLHFHSGAIILYVTKGTAHLWLLNENPVFVLNPAPFCNYRLPHGHKITVIMPFSYVLFSCLGLNQ